MRLKTSQCGVEGKVKESWQQCLPGGGICIGQLAMVYQDLLDKRKTFRCRLDWTERGLEGGK